MSDSFENTVVVPREKTRSETRDETKRQPPYHVILWNDDDHSYAYVIIMMKMLFGYTAEKGYQLAKAVDKTGKAIVLTTTREHAELKQEQIHAFGPDKSVPECVGAMSATIEPAEE